MELHGSAGVNYSTVVHNHQLIPFRALIHSTATKREPLSWTKALVKGYFEETFEGTKRGFTAIARKLTLRADGVPCGRIKEVDSIDLNSKPSAATWSNSGTGVDSSYPLSTQYQVIVVAWTPIAYDSVGID